MNTAAVRISVGIAAMVLGIATPAAMAQGGGGYEIISSTIDGGAHLATGGGYELVGIVPVEAGVVLATFTYQASHDAAGAFLIDVLHDEHAGHQTFLVAADNGKIEVLRLRMEPAIIMVDARGDAP